MGLNELEALLAEWQAILRMRDWEITLVLDHEHIPSDELANVVMQANSQKAEIRLLSTQKYAAGERALGGYDQAVTLVHELLHLKLYMLVSDDDPPIEFAIDSIAEALVNLRRR